MPLFTQEVNSLDKYEDNKELIHEMIKDFEKEFSSVFPKMLQFMLPDSSDRNIATLFKEHIVGKRTRQFYLIMDAGQVAGFVDIYVLIKEKGLHVAGLFVREEYRQKGIAGTILDQLFEKGKSEKFKFIKLNVSPQNRTAYKLYKSKQFNSYTHAMYREL